MTGAGGLYAAERLEALKRTAAGYSRKSKPYQASPASLDLHEGNRPYLCLSTLQFDGLP